jgi:hypothetical protein
MQFGICMLLHKLGKSQTTSSSSHRFETQYEQDLNYGPWPDTTPMQYKVGFMSSAENSLLFSVRNF